MRALPAALLASALCLVARDRFPEHPTDPPARRLSTLERMTLPRLEAVQNDIRRLATQRRPIPPISGVTDFRVICHAHAEDSVHTGGTRPEMLADAHRAGVHAIFLSDHFRPPRDFMDSWRGLHEGVLFVPGAEMRGFLVQPIRSVMDSKDKPVPAFLEAVRAEGGLAFLSYRGTPGPPDGGPRRS